jgi:hypothetical protein
MNEDLKAVSGLTLRQVIKLQNAAIRHQQELNRMQSLVDNAELNLTTEKVRTAKQLEQARCQIENIGQQSRKLQDERDRITAAAVKQGVELATARQERDEARKNAQTYRSQLVTMSDLKKQSDAERDSLRQQLAALTAPPPAADERAGLIAAFQRHAFSAANAVLAQNPDRNPLSALMIRVAELLPKLKADLDDRNQKILGLTRRLAERDRQIAEAGGQHIRDLETIKALSDNLHRKTKEAEQLDLQLHSHLKAAKEEAERRPLQAVAWFGGRTVYQVRMPEALIEFWVLPNSDAEHE